MLEKNPRDRFQSAIDLSDALRKVAAETGQRDLKTWTPIHERQDERVRCNDYCSHITSGAPVDAKNVSREGQIQT